MNTAKRQKIEQFFDAYEARMTGALGDPPKIDVEGTMAAFTECFMEASPKGVSCGKNDDMFRQQIPKGMEFYRSIGTKSMKITSREITELDEHHAMVRVHWQAHYRKQDSSELDVDFDVIYFVQLLDDTVKVFAYISGDEEKLYEEMGLTPQQAQNA